jgi:hypothetical protein
VFLTNISIYAKLLIEGVHNSSNFLIAVAVLSSQIWHFQLLQRAFPYELVLLAAWKLCLWFSYRNIVSRKSLPGLNAQKMRTHVLHTLWAKMLHVGGVDTALIPKMASGENARRTHEMPRAQTGHFMRLSGFFYWSHLDIVDSADGPQVTWCTACLQVLLVFLSLDNLQVAWLHNYSDFLG